MDHSYVKNFQISMHKLSNNETYDQYTIREIFMNIIRWLRDHFIIQQKKKKNNTNFCSAQANKIPRVFSMSEFQDNCKLSL